MSTETQQPHELDKFQTWWGYHGQYCRAGGGEYEASFAWAAWQAAQSSQAAEIEALKAKLASYEAHGVTCQTFGHVVGACAECNTHGESPEAEIAALKAENEALNDHFSSLQNTGAETEALRKDAELWQYWRPWLERRLGDLTPYNAAMQTKEAS